MNGPSPGLVPRPGRAVQGQRGERLLEDLIVRGQMLVTVLTLVEVIIHVELAKIGAS